MDVRERLIQLHSCKGVTNALIKKFIQYDPTLEKIFSIKTNQLQERFLMKKADADLFQEALLMAAEQVNRFQKDEIEIITIFDNHYPVLLKQIYDPPWLLYCKGNSSLLQENKLISVVGTRDPSVNGLRSIEKVLLPLIRENWIVVSGLAVGIDAKAHNLSINNDGKTIAVLGSGFYHVYPQCHKALASQIAKQHLLLSEFPPNSKPKRWNFPMRNRIISGLSIGTVVVEARSRSGSLITADLALQQGREVFAIPGTILDERTEGVHWLIQQGAKLTKNSIDVLNEIETSII